MIDPGEASLKVFLDAVADDWYVSREAASVARRVELLGATVWLVSPEDSILSKVEWARASGSARQVEDATAVVRANSGALDVRLPPRVGRPPWNLRRARENPGSLRI